MGRQRLQLWLAGTLVRPLCHRNGSPKAGRCLCDVIMAGFVNLAHQISCSAHWEPIFEVRLQNFLCFVAVCHR